MNLKPKLSKATTALKTLNRLFKPKATLGPGDHVFHERFLFKGFGVGLSGLKGSKGSGLKGLRFRVQGWG